MIDGFIETSEMGVLTKDRQPIGVQRRYVAKSHKIESDMASIIFGSISAYRKVSQASSTGLPLDSSISWTPEMLLKDDFEKLV